VDEADARRRGARARLAELVAPRRRSSCARSSRRRSRAWPRPTRPSCSPSTASTSRASPSSPAWASRRSAPDVPHRRTEGGARLDDPSRRDRTEAAGVIHSDFETHFIKAEVAAYDDLVQAGSLTALRAEGKARIEGRDYVMREGDVVDFRVGV